MARELLFENLPFVPDSGQAIYVESSYHEKLNKFIRANYHWLRDTFNKHGFVFCYLPILSEEVVSYHAPYLSEEERRTMMTNIPSLADYLVEGEAIEPSLVFSLTIPVELADKGYTCLQSVAVETKLYVTEKDSFISLAKEIEQVAIIQERHYREDEEEEIGKESEQPRFSLGTPDNDIRFSIAEEPDADYKFDSESMELIDKIKTRIKALRNKGVNTLFLHNIIDKEERLSRLRITKDFRIFLVDYNNMEIRLRDLPKAVFLLFLHHPEGIRFKELTDYYPELLKIYLALNPIGDRMRQEQSIRDVTDPCNNSINEKCVRIRWAFVRNFDDRLAQNYYVTGKRGEPQRITLDNSMIIWE